MQVARPSTATGSRSSCRSSRSIAPSSAAVGRSSGSFDIARMTAASSLGGVSAATSSAVAAPRPRACASARNGRQSFARTEVFPPPSRRSSRPPRRRRRVRRTADRTPAREPCTRASRETFRRASPSPSPRPPLRRSAWRCRSRSPSQSDRRSFRAERRCSA